MITARRRTAAAAITALAAVSLTGCSSDGLGGLLGRLSSGVGDSAPAAGSTVDTSAAFAALNSLTVRPKGSMTAYTGNRTLLFGEPWTDDNYAPVIGRNGCRTREDILQRDLINTTRSGCFVDTGTLQDPYTGKTIQYKRGIRTSAAVQIDHLVSLGNVWASGGNFLSQRQRVNIANDPINLQATDGPANGSKGDKDASEWLPPNEKHHCIYVAAQINVKYTYKLSVTAREKQTMSTILRTKCGPADAPAFN